MVKKVLSAAPSDWSFRGEHFKFTCHFKKDLKEYMHLYFKLLNTPYTEVSWMIYQY